MVSILNTIGFSMNRFFTSDFHFGHRFVAGLRGFEDVDSHDQWIIKNYNATVNPSDIVYILGDVTLSNWGRALELCSQLNGVKRLIAGNHDAVWTQHKQWRKHLMPTLEIFESVAMFEQTSINGVKVNMSHLPYQEHDREGDGRYMDIRLTGPTPLLHGHTHGTETAHDNMFHVGWDAHFKPVSESEIVRSWDAVKR